MLYSKLQLYCKRHKTDSIEAMKSYYLALDLSDIDIISTVNEFRAINRTSEIHFILKGIGDI